MTRTILILMLLISTIGDILNWTDHWIRSPITTGTSNISIELYKHNNYHGALEQSGSLLEFSSKIISFN